MTRFFAAFIFTLLCAVNSSFGQTPALMWQKCLGGNNGDYASSIEPTADGGFVAAGYTEGLDNGDIMGYHGNLSVGDIWVVKTDNAGNIQWQKCLGGNSFETGAYIHQTADGGYILAGTSASTDCNFQDNHGGADYLVIKLNSKGDIVWQKFYGGSMNEYAWSISIAPDGGYIVAGETESSNGDITVNHGIRDYWVIRLDISGNLVWQKSLGGTGDDEAYSVQATSDGGCVVAGYTESNDGDVAGNHGKRDYWVVKLDNTGNIQWQKALGGSTFDGAWSVQLTKDGGYIVAGYSGSNDGDVSGNHQGFGPGDADYWIVKLSSTGSVQWQKCYGGNLNEIAYFIQPTMDGGYVVAGSSESADGDLTCNAGITDMWIIKISSTGILQWQKEIGGNYYDEPHCIKELADGTYIIAGNTCSKNISGYHIPTNLGTCGDFWIVKLSAPVSVVPNPVITINPASANVCTGVTATLTASTLYAGLNPIYHWTKNGATVGGNSLSYTASGLANGDQITCSITSGGTPCETNSVLSSDAEIITANTHNITPQITISADNTIICNCAAITFKSSLVNAGASPVYQWKVNGRVTGNNTGIFTSNTLAPGDVITCVYSDNSSCVANGSVVSNSIQISSGSTSSSSISISASPDSLCAGSIETFTANPVNAGVNPAYQWKVNGINAGINNAVFTSSSLANADVVTCTLTPDPSFSCAGGGIATSNSIVVNVNNKGFPLVNITTASDTICTGSAATFVASTMNAGSNPLYQWKINGISTGSNTKILTTSSLSNADVVTCTLTTDPLYSCALANSATSNSIIINVKVQTPPSVNISSSVNNVCKGEKLTFNAVAQNAGVSPSYQWVLNNTSLDNRTAVFTSNSLSNGDALYCLITPGSNSCSSSSVSSNIITAIIKDLPELTIIPNDTTINISQKVQLNAMVSGNLASYQWMPADKLENQFTLTPSTVNLTDNITYTLTVQSDNGCKTSSSAIVKVIRLLVMPNAFTPNGDGTNEIFHIPAGVSLQLQEFSIFDRWGTRIFTTKNISEGWYGTFKGTPVDAGTYVYIIKGKNEKGNILLKGSVILLR